MLHGAELAGGGRPASLLARRPTRTAAVAGKGTSSPCEHQLAWAGLAKASSRHRALRSPTPSFPPFPFVTGGATVAAFLHSELAPRPLPFHVPSPTFACVPLARAWRAAQRQAERRRRHGRSAAASTRRAEARQASRQRPEWHRAAPHRPPGCCEHPPLSAPARGPQCGSSPAACCCCSCCCRPCLVDGEGEGGRAASARRRGQRGWEVRRHRQPNKANAHAARGAFADTRRGGGDRTAPHRRPSGVAPHSVFSATRYSAIPKTPHGCKEIARTPEKPRVACWWGLLVANRMIFYAKNVPPAPPAARRSATKARSGVKAFRRRRQGCPPGCECAQAADLGVGGEAELPAARRRRRRDGGSRSLELADTGSCARRRAVSATTREKNPTPACAQPAVAPGTELPPQGATRRRSAQTAGIRR